MPATGAVAFLWKWCLLGAVLLAFHRPFTTPSDPTRTLPRVINADELTYPWYEWHLWRVQHSGRCACHHATHHPGYLTPTTHTAPATAHTPPRAVEGGG